MHGHVSFANPIMQNVIRLNSTLANFFQVCPKHLYIYLSQYPYFHKLEQYLAVAYEKCPCVKTVKLGANKSLHNYHFQERQLMVVALLSADTQPPQNIHV